MLEWYLCFFTEGYALSWDLVDFAANSEGCEMAKNGQEDVRMADCIRSQLSRGLSRSNNIEDIFDEPSAGTEWSHEYTPTTLFLHRLKRNDWFLKASAAFTRFERDQVDAMNKFDWTNQKDYKFT